MPKKKAKRTTTRKKKVRAKSAPSSSDMRPLTIILYGPSGVGKTDVAANFPDVEFIHDPKEDGIRDLIAWGRCNPIPDERITEVDSFMGLLEACDAACHTDSQTVALDAITGFEELCFEYHCDNYFDGDWSRNGFYAYQQGPKNAAKTDWPTFLDRLDNIKRAGKHVILIGHSHVKPFKNPDGGDFDQYIPFLDKEIWAISHRWAQIVLFYNYIVDIDEKAKKAKGADSRALFTEHGASFIAKNRMGLPPVIEAGDSGEDCFNNLMSALEASKP